MKMNPNEPIKLPPLSKIPGNLTAPSKERYVDDLPKYTLAQLDEIREREENLLSNKKRLEKLPDKGKRIKDFYARIINEIENRNEIEKAAELFSTLNIATKGIETLTSMEWNGKYNSQFEHATLDSDDDEDEMDPIKILAQSRQTVKSIKIINNSEETLITKNDLNEIQSFDQHTDAQHSRTYELEPHMLHICQKEVCGENKTKFLPFKTSKTDVHSVEKEKSRKVNKHWEVTAATPPILRNSKAKLLPLQESLDIQARQMGELKIIEANHAEERLARRKELAQNILPIGAAQPFGKDLSVFFRSYRELIDSDTSADDSDDLIDSDNEVYDDEPRDGGISIVVNNVD